MLELLEEQDLGNENILVPGNVLPLPRTPSTVLVIECFLKFVIHSFIYPYIDISVNTHACLWHISLWSLQLPSDLIFTAVLGGCVYHVCMCVFLGGYVLSPPGR